MQTSQRQPYLDWLRIIAIIGVLVLHAAMPFATGEGWHIRNKETSNVLLELVHWLHMFRMPLLFFISGAISYCMLQNRTGAGFIGLRFTRLFIPLLFGMLVIVPPQVYLERVTNGYKGNFWQFYAHMFTTGPYPKGDISWHHLWFILYLLIYDIICTPFFTYMVSPASEQLRKRLQWLGQGKRIFLLVTPAVIIYTSMVIQFPETNALVGDWCFLLYWLSFLVPGFICMAVPGLMDSLERNRRFSLQLAFISLVLVNYVRWNDIEPWDILANWKTDARTYMYLAARALCGWTWVLAAIGYGKRYLDRKHRVLDYLNQAVYPFYILHQTVIVILAFYVVQVPETVGMKYIFIFLVTFMISMGIYHLFIRPFTVARFLFGMKPGKRKTVIVPHQKQVQTA
ncbi:acyltransferase family protein [Chitinophaga tropicalis]|uniref:Acyltransferase family protein n=1 Tax=Chitinophaga tropicalis TaxID=2683588 RepID=A0A7K1U0Z6_9BACT|nr:acyltransferase family protein [Chitinophaga tropicalis]MVT08028.1 acyltransferase family protein [Chitinophaga tropicalis]